MKVVFLDFDGVISTFEKRWSLDSEKLILLKQIVDNTNCVFVISSSWKVGYKDVEHFCEKLRSHPKIKNRLKENEMSLVEWLCDNTFDITDSDGSTRGDEIQRWLDSHKDNIESYVILDDDSDMLESQLCNFIQTDTFEGITSREVKLCIKLLNHEEINNPIRMNLELITMWRNKCSDVEKNNIEQILMTYYNKFKN